MAGIYLRRLEGTGNFWVPKTLLCWRFFSDGFDELSKNKFLSWPHSRPKWAKCIPVVRPKRRKNPTRWSGTYLYSLYKGVPPGGGGLIYSGFSLLFHLNSYRAFFCLKVKCFLPCKMHHCSLWKRNCCLENPRVCSQRKGACVFFQRPSNSKERDSNHKWVAISYLNPV